MYINDRYYGWKFFTTIFVGFVVSAALIPPLWHWLIFDLLFQNLVIVIAIFFTVVFWGLVYFNEEYTRFKSTAVGVVGILVVIFLIIFSGPIADQYLVQAISPTKLPALLDTNRMRYIPFEVAKKFGENQMQSSTQQVGDFDPLDDSKDQEIVWTTPRVPTGIFNSFFGSTDGIEIIRDGTVDTQSQKFACGEGMALWRDAMWQFTRTHYFSTPTDIYYLVVGDEILTISPYITYHLVFPSMVPEWGGVMVMHKDCNIEDLSPDQAMVDLRFKNQRLYPEALAKRVANGWQYRLGVVNAFFQHNDQTDLPDMDSSNQMPYLLSTSDGPQWFSALEPYGAQSHGTKEILYIDAHSGTNHTQTVEYTGSSLVGPKVAAGYITSAFPSYNWYKVAEDGKTSQGTIVAIEPRPISRQGKLYWLYSVTSTSYANVTQSALLNAADKSVYSCASLDELRGFAAGKDVCKLVVTASDGSQTPPVQQAVSPVVPPANQALDTSAIHNMTDTQLLDLQQQILDEMKNRQKKQ